MFFNVREKNREGFVDLVMYLDAVAYLRPLANAMSVVMDSPHD